MNTFYTIFLLFVIFVSSFDVKILQSRLLPAMIELPKKCLHNVHDILVAVPPAALFDDCSLCNLLGELAEEPLCLIADDKLDVPIEQLVSFHCVAAWVVDGTKCNLIS